MGFKREIIPRILRNVWLNLSPVLSAFYAYLDLQKPVTFFRYFLCVFNAKTRQKLLMTNRGMQIDLNMIEESARLTFYSDLLFRIQSLSMKIRDNR